MVQNIRRKSSEVGFTCTSAISGRLYSGVLDGATGPGFLHRIHPSLSQLQTCRPVAILVSRFRVLQETGENQSSVLAYLDSGRHHA
jgi:hypothetical protein